VVLEEEVAREDRLRDLGRELPSQLSGARSRKFEVLSDERSVACTANAAAQSGHDSKCRSNSAAPAASSSPSKYA
jgi:hypothetical protein